MRALPAGFGEYRWAPSTDAIAGELGLDPTMIRRFDGNVPASPSPTAGPSSIVDALAKINEYAHGGFPALVDAIAEYAGVEPENVVLGAGADDLILLCARTFASAGDVVAIDVSPTYPLFQIAAQLAGAEVGDLDPVVTFTCRPNNPTGSLGTLSSARPLVVDEAYFEYAGETAAGLMDDGVVVLRTFSKAFGLAGARVGYALADTETAAELNRRQSPQPISGISAALALAALAAGPPDVIEQVDERERCAGALAEIGLAPLPSWANFLFVPMEGSDGLGAALLGEGLVVRVFPDGIRFSVRDREDDDRLLDALARLG
jgi:histidinol-phosphate aminotransferase